MSFGTVDDRRAHSPTASVASNGESCGATSPRSVTRGETPGERERAPVFVDWLAFTVTPPPSQRRDWIEEWIHTLFRIPRDDWNNTGKGWFGYRHRIDLGVYGLLAFGGEAQKGTYHVELNAHACALVEDWKAVHLWGETYAANVTRVDLAHDDFNASAISIERAIDWLKEGTFTAGRPPKGRLLDDLGSGDGKTLYVGSRGAGKLLRVYEKGKQLGDSRSPWVRAEVELRNKGRMVPWDVVTAPSSYFVGAYPILRFLDAEQSRVRTRQRAAQISYDAMVNTLRTQGGKALGVMCRVHEGDAAAVLVQVVREGEPKRLRGFSVELIARTAE